MLLAVLATVESGTCASVRAEGCAVGSAPWRALVGAGGSRRVQQQLPLLSVLGEIIREKSAPEPLVQPAFPGFPSQPNSDI